MYILPINNHSWLNVNIIYTKHIDNNLNVYHILCNKRVARMAETIINEKASYKNKSFSKYIVIEINTFVLSICRPVYRPYAYSKLLSEWLFVSVCLRAFVDYGKTVIVRSWYIYYYLVFIVSNHMKSLLIVFSYVAFFVFLFMSIRR